MNIEDEYSEKAAAAAAERAEQRRREQEQRRAAATTPIAGDLTVAAEGLGQALGARVIKRKKRGQP